MTDATAPLLRKLTDMGANLESLRALLRENSLATARTHARLQRLESLARENAWIRWAFPATSVLDEDTSDGEGFLGGDAEGDARVLSDTEFSARYGVGKEVVPTLLESRDVLGVVSRRGSLVVVCGGAGDEFDAVYSKFVGFILSKLPGRVEVFGEEEVEGWVEFLMGYVPREGSVEVTIGCGSGDGV